MPHQKQADFAVVGHASYARARAHRPRFLPYDLPNAEFSTQE
jgi:hypothetical protein